MVASNRTTIKYSHKFSCVLVYFENLLENTQKSFFVQIFKKKYRNQFSVHGEWK